MPIDTICNADSLLHHPDKTLSPAVIQQHQKQEEDIEMYKAATTGLDCQIVQGVRFCVVYLGAVHAQFASQFAASGIRIGSRTCSRIHY